MPHSEFPGGNKRKELAMKNYRTVVLFLATLAIFALNVLNIGCGGGIEAEYATDETAAADQVEPTVEEPTSEPEKPATEPVTEPVEEPTSEPEETADCQDLDGDGYCSPGDCNDSELDENTDGLVDGYFIHKGATELCDEIDNDCDGETDEGLESMRVYEDLDKDGHGAGEELSVCSDKGYVHSSNDCDDSDADIHPGAADEAGDGVDSDCDDETAPVTEDPKADLSISIRYGSSAHRVLSYQVYTVESDLGGWWTEDSAAVSDSSGLHFETTFDKDVYGDPSEFLGVRFNVANGDPATSWLCMGNMSTASFTEVVLIEVVFLGEVYTTGDVETWSDPTGAGCSAVIPF
jgi:hypothetical protein